jgi:hypothetical protein
LRFLQEREEKRKLEKKIEIMKFQMIQGGQKVKIEDTPEFKTLIQKHQILLQKDFNEKLNDLEKEKELIQISKEQVDSYNDLLNKQKETMESLTNNLKEKEDNINHLNEMIDSYEKIINEQDNIIEIKNQRIKLLENLLIKNNVSFPKETITQTNYINNNNINGKDDKIDNLIDINGINDKDINENKKKLIIFSNNNIKEKDKDYDDKIKENNNKVDENSIEEIINIDINKGKNNEDDINNKSKSNVDSKIDFEIINNNLSQSKNSINIKEITLENNPKYQYLEDEENYNVVISGSLNKSNKKTNKLLKEIKSSKNLTLISSIAKESKKGRNKISKKTESDNNLFFMQSKDKTSFNNETKKNIKIIKTPNISTKSRSRTKVINKSKNNITNSKKKK